MKHLMVALGVWTAAVVGVAGQTAPLSPVFIVRLDPGARTPDSGPDWATATGPAALWTRIPGSAAADPTSLQLQPLSITRLDDSGASAILDAPRPLSLRFSAAQPAREVLLLLVHDTGLSLVASPEVDGTFVGELSGVTLRQALELVLRAQGLDYVVEGTAIRVFRRPTETRFFDFNAIAVRRAGNTSGDAFDEMAAGVPALLSADGRFVVDRKAGLVQVTDYRERLDRVAVYIESTERRLRRQVDIQARVVEVTWFDAAAPGVNWAAAVEQARTTADGGVATIDFNAFVKALAQQGTVDVLASSDVKALHNEQATIRVGVQAAAFDGFALAVTPHITADGAVLMSVAPSVSQTVADEHSGRPGAPSATAISELSTAVRLRDGETLVLPGIRRAHSEIAVLLTTKVM